MTNYLSDFDKYCEIQIKFSKEIDKKLQDQRSRSLPFHRSIYLNENSKATRINKNLTKTAAQLTNEYLNAYNTIEQQPKPQHMDVPYRDPSLLHSNTQQQVTNQEKKKLADRQQQKVKPYYSEKDSMSMSNSTWYNQVIHQDKNQKQRKVFKTSLESSQIMSGAYNDQDDILEYEYNNIQEVVNKAYEIPQKIEILKNQKLQQLGKSQNFAKNDVKHSKSLGKSQTLIQNQSQLDQVRNINEIKRQESKKDEQRFKKCLQDFVMHQKRKDSKLDQIYASAANCRACSAKNQNPVCKIDKDWVIENDKQTKILKQQNKAVRSWSCHQKSTLQKQQNHNFNNNQQEMQMSKNEKWKLNVNDLVQKVYDKGYDIDKYSKSDQQEFLNYLEAETVKNPNFRCSVDRDFTLLNEPRRPFSCQTPKQQKYQRNVSQVLFNPQQYQFQRKTPDGRVSLSKKSIISINKLRPQINEECTVNPRKHKTDDSDLQSQNLSKQQSFALTRNQSSISNATQKTTDTAQQNQLIQTHIKPVEEQRDKLAANLIENFANETGQNIKKPSFIKNFRQFKSQQDICDDYLKQLSLNKCGANQFNELLVQLKDANNNELQELQQFNQQEIEKLQFKCKSQLQEINKQDIFVNQSEKLDVIIDSENEIQQFQKDKVEQLKINQQLNNEVIINKESFDENQRASNSISFNYQDQQQLSYNADKPQVQLDDSVSENFHSDKKLISQVGKFNNDQAQNKIDEEDSLLINNSAQPVFLNQQQQSIDLQEFRLTSQLLNKELPISQEIKDKYLCLAQQLNHNDLFQFITQITTNEELEQQKQLELLEELKRQQNLKKPEEIELENKIERIETFVFPEQKHPALALMSNFANHNVAKFREKVIQELKQQGILQKQGVKVDNNNFGYILGNMIMEVEKSMANTKKYQKLGVQKNEVLQAIEQLANDDLQQESIVVRDRSGRQMRLAQVSSQQIEQKQEPQQRRSRDIVNIWLPHLQIQNKEQNQIELNTQEQQQLELIDQKIENDSVNTKFE